MRQASTIQTVPPYDLKILAIALLSALALPAHAVDEFTGLGTLGGTYSSASGISADSTVVVGFSNLTNNAGSHAFRWTAAGNMVDLGTLGGTNSFAIGVSADGAVVVGGSHLTGDAAYHVFRWTAAGNMVDLGTLGGTNSFAVGVSADGAVVAGGSLLAGDAAYHAYRWTAAGMADLGTLGGTYSSARGISANGTVVVGESSLAGNAVSRAFRWTAADNMVDLGTLGGTHSLASGISADGAVVVGFSNLTGNAGSHAFRWTAAGNMVDLGTLGGTNSLVSGVSADGAVVVGRSDLTGDEAYHAYRWTAAGMADLGTLGGTYSSAGGVSADGTVVVGTSYLAGNVNNGIFRWTAAGGIQSVENWLAGAGVTLPAGWTLRPTGVGAIVNSDGSVLVGDSLDPNGANQTWLARVGGAGSGFLGNISAFNSTLTEAGMLGVQGAGLPNLALFGVHHRSLLGNGLARTKDGTCAWATADASGQSNTNSRSQITEAGACKDIGTARLGVGMGKAWARQDWSSGGSAKYDGQYLILEVANAYAGGMEASVTGYFGRLNTELRRNYQNGAAVDSSSGKPNTQSTALRARVDWKDRTQLGQFSLSPYASYTWMENKMDGYTETGGGFPAQFAASTSRTNDLRLGSAAKTTLSAVTDLRLGLEVAHRLDSSTNGVNGQVIGLWSFSLPCQEVTKTWARVTADVDHRLSNTTVLTFGANAASPGSDASWAVTVGLRANF